MLNKYPRSEPFSGKSLWLISYYGGKKNPTIGPYYGQKRVEMEIGSPAPAAFKDASGTEGRFHAILGKIAQNQHSI